MSKGRSGDPRDLRSENICHLLPPTFVGKRWSLSPDLRWEVGFRFGFGLNGRETLEVWCSKWQGKKKFHLDERDEWKIKRSQEPFIQVEAWAVSEQESNRDI